MIETRAVLAEIGFAQVDETTFRWSFGNGEVKALECVSMQLRPIMFLSGLYKTATGFGQIEYDMPLEVESKEQGLAYLAYACGRCEPFRATPWLAEGRALQHHLPWVRKMAAYKARPTCAVDKSWFRLVAKELRTAADHATATDCVEFAFDGVSLRIAFGSRMLSWYAIGVAWPRSYHVSLVAMSHLPKRFMRETVYLDIWEDRLGIDRVRFALTETETIAADT